MESCRRRRLVICISGLAATGKSTVARKLAKALNIKYVSGGQALKQLAIERGYKPGGEDWWEKPEGLKFLEERSSNPEFDKLVDAKLLELASEGDVVIDSWVMPWLLKDGYKIWLKASEDERARRLSKRSGLPVDVAKEVLRKRDSESKDIYNRLYGILLESDLSPFDVVLDTTGMDEDEVYKVLLSLIKHHYGLD
ncbi:MAG: cytidylate kinase family protein [Thaumarchaeota archaeon]|jgi:cytidylate kinase|nr:cytidylate kinase family protein [Candidatus Terraquivivens yellowstonensis]MCL7392106.1 cytidylate kinase family protein [Candidatus Terraquivivens yellowstonensis]MCL7395068.1 cytidylate kinase family protein [Candidatus Terraquivivens yellowstonensis]MCL7398265.1 cytidylate kinase family protein [Candidatus Terraquivivens yellowstonensis]MCL7399296.1 cytidylate kinase family protein [Candidatus Terraquivivens yellowstonensis]